MNDLLGQYVRIALLQGKPQDLPGDSRQLRIGVALSFVMYVLLESQVSGLALGVATALLDIGLSALTMWLALVAWNRTERFNQAFGALSGASAVIAVAAAPMFLMLPAVAEEGQRLSPVIGYSFFLMVWSLSLLGFVIRHTFTVSMPISVIAAVVVFVLLTNIQYSLLAWLRPEAAESQVSDVDAEVFPARAVSESAFMSATGRKSVAEALLLVTDDNIRCPEIPVEVSSGNVTGVSGATEAGLV
ncbi:MAG: hypothetical protein CSB44_04695 [Gammaproteobacteria bacterium]|nr:MAG: hypothetical protein CSB44_04695 [Gammaproteobacteria bacterium]PIE37173.1 MAG: hypothetical protein CSA54_01995 [Gammaproteobacteria bacterium]